MTEVKNGSPGRKVVRIKTELLRQIKMNNFPRGKMLPPERELAQRFGVSYMTARKAVGELVEERYLARQPGVGTFVRRDISRNRLNGVLGIICPAWNSPEIADFTILASLVAETNDWCPKLFFCRSWEDRMIEEAWKECDALWIIPPGPVQGLPAEQQAWFSSREKPVIFIGVGVDVLGIDAVMGASGLAIRMVMDAFRAAGHRRVAYISQYIGDGSSTLHPDRVDYDYWREWVAAELGPRESERLFIRIDVPPYTLASQIIYDRLMTAGRNGADFTAMVVGFPLLWGVIAALADLGLRVPEDVSIIALGDRQESAFYRPRITQVSKSLREHAEKAMAATDYRLRHRQTPPQCLLVEPAFIAGESVFDRS